MRRLRLRDFGLVIPLLLAALYVAIRQYTAEPPPGDDTTRVAEAFEQQRSDLQVRLVGTVERVLTDDEHGGRHQRFIMRLSNDQTVLVAHNIDLAPRVPAMQSGEPVSVYGEYEYNPLGGVVHWTHRDPANRHPHGWIEYRGKRYQ